MYRKQINDLDYPAELIRLYLCEGDSDDNTLVELTDWANSDGRLRVINHNTGIPHHAHSTRPERMKAVAENGNKGWDAIAADNWGEYALMLESDLLYEPDLLVNLLTRRPDEANIFAPMIWIDVGGRLRFYDIWAYRKDGEMFLPYSPTWYQVHLPNGQPFEVDSVGSVVLFQMALILDGLRLSESECVLGLCNNARSQGYRIFCDPAINVLHPSIKGVW